MVGKADAVVPYISLGLKSVPLIAPEFAPAPLELDEQLGPITMGLQAAPHVANTASHIASKVDNVTATHKIACVQWIPRSRKVQDQTVNAKHIQMNDKHNFWTPQFIGHILL